MRGKRLLALICAALLLAPAAGMAADVPRGTFYEIYVRAYADSNGDGIGDLKGLTQKLDYLDDLGVSGLWLMPVFEARSDHGYDVIDYRTIDPDYGTNDDMRALLEAAHERDIAVIVDLPVNHTSTDCPWFADALKGGEKRDWYHFFDEATDDPALLTAAPWGSMVWHQSEGGRYYGLFWSGMPDLNLSNDQVKAELADIAKFWLGMGVDGFRLDATSHFFGYGEEAMEQQTARSGAFLKEFQTELRAAYPDCYIVGEAWEKLEKREDILRGIESVFDFDFSDRVIRLMNAGGDANKALSRLCDTEAACAAVNPAFLNAPFLTNHDQERVMTQLGGDQAKYRLAVGVLLTFSGNPFLYYGEEIGMLGSKPDEQLRTPMLWGADDPLTCTFMESAHNKDTVPLAGQAADEGSLYHYVRALARLRREHGALRAGMLEPLDSGSGKLMMYRRTDGDESILVIHNFATEAKQPPVTIDEAALLFGSLTDGLLPPMSTVVVLEQQGGSV